MEEMDPYASNSPRIEGLSAIGEARASVIQKKELPRHSSSLDPSLSEANSTSMQMPARQNPHAEYRSGEEFGEDCYANDREALSDFAKYFNSPQLSDISLVVGEDKFPAHKIVLCRSSEVFERMLSERWTKAPRREQATKGKHCDPAELELNEESQCRDHFHAFLSFLYSNRVRLNSSNSLPLLMLADKYGVAGLRRVCINFTITHLLPEAELQEVFHVWFNYATRSAHHPQLIEACLRIIAPHFHHIATSAEWERDWLALDKEQLAEFLGCNELVVPNEYCVWEALVKWLSAEAYPVRRSPANCHPLLTQLLPLLRFPHIGADELAEVETSQLAQQHPRLFAEHTHLAYKFIAMPLASRCSKRHEREFGTQQFLLRAYTETRWSRVVVLSSKKLLEHKGKEQVFQFATRSTTLSQPAQWNWSLGCTMVPATGEGREHLRLTLTADDVDHTSRSVEWLLMVVDENRVVGTVAGAKSFTKARYSAELELNGCLDTAELLTNRRDPLLAERRIYEIRLQLLLRPLM